MYISVVKSEYYEKFEFLILKYEKVTFMRTK